MDVHATSCATREPCLICLAQIRGAWLGMRTVHLALLAFLVPISGCLAPPLTRSDLPARSSLTVMANGSEPERYSAEDPSKAIVKALGALLGLLGSGGAAHSSPATAGVPLREPLLPRR